MSEQSLKAKLKRVPSLSSGAFDAPASPFFVAPRGLGALRAYVACPSPALARRFPPVPAPRTGITLLAKMDLTPS